jgi:uncharacterized protein (DUF305 family)
MSRVRRTVLPALLAAALLVAGCSDDDAGQSAAHDAADVEFATQMIPHHEQALQMVAMTGGRELSADFEHLTEHVHDAQQPEIETMAGWLQDWDEPVPSGHVHHDGMDMSGMMSEDDLTRLGGADRSAFEQMWLRMMIEHHEGAIEMAETELEDGSFEPALELARSIIDSQSHEIDGMREMLGAPAG